MNEFYELAKLFDVVVIFCFFLGIGMYVHHKHRNGFNFPYSQDF